MIDFELYHPQRISASDLVHRSRVALVQHSAGQTRLPELIRTLLATTLIMFAQPHAVAAGGLVSIHDSGGERQLLIDLAHDAGVPLTQLTPASTRKLESQLDPGLPAVNPLDAWSTGGPDYHVGMQRCFATLLGDPGAALGAVVHDRVAGGGIHDSYLDYLRAAHGATGKPVFLVANAQGTGTDSVRGNMMPSAPESSVRATRSYWKSATRTIGVIGVSRQTCRMSCTVWLVKGPCSVSRKNQSRPAAAAILATSTVGKAFCAVPRATLPSRSICFTRFWRISSPVCQAARQKTPGPRQPQTARRPATKRGGCALAAVWPAKRSGQP